MSAARARADAMWDEDGASRGLGMVLDDAGPGYARVSMPVTAAMVNGLGLCHGGFIFALADSAMAFASNGHGERAVALHAAITFLRPGRLGQVLTATAAERAVEGRSGLYAVSVTADDGARIAEFNGHTRTIGKPLIPDGG